IGRTSWPKCTDYAINRDGLGPKRTTTERPAETRARKYYGKLGGTTSRILWRGAAAPISEPGCRRAEILQDQSDGIRLIQMRRQTISLVAFSVSMFLSAALLFLLEPMFAKMALPLLGGSAAVWTTCLVFFQVTLLAGYAYAHASAKLLGKRTQVAVHAAVLLAPLALLPVHVPRGWAPPLQSNPVGWLLWLLLVAVGLPFFALSATTPILQKWFAQSGDPSSGDPYFL